MPKDENKIRLVVLVTKEGHPELFEDLSQRSQKFRTERLRTLSTMALMGQGISYQPPHEGRAKGSMPEHQEQEMSKQDARDGTAQPAESKEEMQARELEKKRRRLRDDLRAGLKKDF